MTFVFYTRTSTCHVMSCFTHAFHVLEAHVRISLLFQRGRATPSTHLVRDIIVCRKTSDHLRMAALLLLEAASRPPPALLLLEDVRAPPHTEKPFLPVRTTMTLISPSWSPSWSLPPPMRAAATDPRTGDAAPAPRECLSEAHCHLLRHAAVRTLSLLGHAPAVFKKKGLFHPSPTAALSRAVVP